MIIIFPQYSISPIFNFKSVYFCVPIFHWQVLIEITEASSVITWDFDVCKSDAVFNIYHSRKASQTQKKDTLTNLTGPGGNNMQVIDKSWILGTDYSLVEAALTCREGESIQVTYHMLR